MFINIGLYSAVCVMGDYRCTLSPQFKELSVHPCDLLIHARAGLSNSSPPGATSASRLPSKG